MKAEPAATLHPADHAGRRLLAGRTRQPISKGAWLVLVKDGDAYTLHMASDDRNDPHATVTLASFLAPEQIDDIERGHALEAAAPTSKPKRKRKPATKRQRKVTA